MKRRVVAACIVVLGLGFAGVACGNDHPNKDPRKGYVHVNDSVGKECVGPNLVWYIDRGGNVERNSPECV